MRTPERTWHLRLWLVIGPLCVAGLVLALALRPREARPAAWPEPPLQERDNPALPPTDEGPS